MGKFNDLLIEIGIDTKPAMDKINKLDKAFDDLGKSFQAVTRKKPPKDQFNLGAERAKMQKFIRELKSLGAETESYQKQLKGLKNASQFKSMQQDLAKYKKDFLAFKDAESKNNLKTVKDRQKAETRANSEIERARIKQAQYTNKKLTEEHSKKSPELQSMKEFYQQQEREARKTSPKEKKRSQADINRENSLLKQKKLLKEINALGLKPSYDKLDTLAKQNTALERQVRKYKAIEEYSEKAARNIYRSEQFRNMSPSDQRQVSRRVSQAQSDFKVTGDKDVFRTLNRDVKSFQRSLIGLQTVQNGLSDSTRNMVRAYASLFALIEGTTAIKNVGMDFESLRASMLAASTSQEDAKKKLEFVRVEARRLGVDLVAASKAYMQLSIAGKDLIDTKTIDKLFVTTMEAATAFGMSLDDTKGTFRAFIQMLSKGNVQAEELRGQLGERLYGAFNLAAKSLGKTTSELNKMLEQGQVLAKDLIPAMIPNIQKLARNNGALEKQLESTRTAQNRLVFDIQSAADKIFTSGFSEGLKELYDTLSEEIDSTGSSQKDLGNIYNKFFKLITLGIKVVTPLLESLVQIVSFSVDGFYETAKGIGTATDNLKTMSPALYDAAKAVGVLAFAFNTLLGKVLVVFGALQEIVSLFNDDLVGKLEQQMGKQINLKTMRQEVIVETKEGIFSGEDYGVNVNLKVDKDLKSFEDINKFLEDNNLTATGFAESMGMKVADLKTSVENGLSDSIKTALKTYTLDENMKEQAEKLGGSFEELITSVEDGALSLKEFSSVIRGITNSVADSDGVIAAVSSLSLELVLAVAALVSFKKGLGSIIEKIFGIKSPTDVVKNTSKSGGYMAELLAFLANPTTIASGALAAPVLYSAAKMSEDPTASLESIKESGLYSGRFNQANRFMEAQQRQQLQNSVNQTINLSGFEIPITITNPSDLDEVRRAGQAAGEGFLTTLELSNLLKGGR